MDYQPTTNQNPPPTMNQNQPVEPPKSSGSIWKWVVIIAVLIVAAGLAWYFYFRPAPLPAPQPAAEESQPTGAANIGATSSGDTTADIANDLNQTPDDSAPTQEMNSLNQNIQNF